MVLGYAAQANDSTAASECLCRDYGFLGLYVVCVEDRAADAAGWKCAHCRQTPDPDPDPRDMSEVREMFIDLSTEVR